MRRTIALTILIVVLATLLNLAIALGFWWFGERPPPLTPSTFDLPPIVDLRPRDLAVWRDRRGPDWPQEPQGVTRHDYLGVTFRSMLWYESEWSYANYDIEYKVTKVDCYSIDIVELGWPFRCITGERWGEYHPPSGPIQSASGMFVAFGAQWPNRVLWLRMVMNEVFYGAAIVMPFVGWIHGRRAVRRRRGRCPQCAYDLRGDLSSGCPECGQGRQRA